MIFNLLAIPFSLLFFLGIATLGFTYIGFPIALTLIGFLKSRTGHVDDSPGHITLPAVQVIIPCYNEAEIIKRCLENILAQEYPPGQLSILVISDGSTDGSNAIVEEIANQNPAVKIYALPQNSGKNNALNSAFNAGQFTGSLLCFTDADTAFEPGALASSVRYFFSPHVGLVGGKISYWLGSGSSHRAEGIFWILENFLREAEGNLGCLVSCPGQFIVMRRDLYQPLPADGNTDFALPLSVLAQGYVTKMNPRAQVRSLFPAQSQEVLRRRKRTIIRALTTMAFYRNQLPRPIRVVMFWHKTARFYAFPFQLIILIVNSLALLITPTVFWSLAFSLQIIFYSCAGLGWLSDRLDIRIPLVHGPYQFTRQNFVAFSAVISFLRGQRILKWIPPR
jgi:cellulose synthase/poly-beta-1,6-N-acetylglucosamine synthase-like glycosyltransferase